MNKIPDKYRDLLDRPVVVSLATLMKGRGSARAL